MDPILSISTMLNSADMFYIIIVNGHKPFVMPTKIKLFRNNRILFAVEKYSYEHTLMIERPRLSVVAAISHDRSLIYEGTVAFVEDEELTRVILRRVPDLKRYYNELTGKTLQWFYLSNPSAYLQYTIGERQRIL